MVQIYLHLGSDLKLKMILPYVGSTWLKYKLENDSLV